MALKVQDVAARVSVARGFINVDTMVDGGKRFISRSGGV